MTKTTLLLRGAAGLAVLALVTGCGDPPDKRLLDLAQQSLAQQARQNEQLAQLQQQIQAERAQFGRQRDELERERRELAAQRGRDPIVAQSIGAIGVTLACLLPLLLAAYVLFTVNRTSPDADAQAVSEILIGEIVSPAPQLLPGPIAMRQLEVKPTKND